MNVSCLPDYIPNTMNFNCLPDYIPNTMNFNCINCLYTRYKEF